MGASLVIELPQDTAWSSVEVEGPRPWRIRFLVAVVVTAVAGLLVGVQLPARDLTHPGAAGNDAPAIDARTRAEQAGIDIDATVDQVRHAIRYRNGMLAVSDASATTTFEADGFRVVPASSSSASDALSISLSQVAGRAVDPAAWTAAGNVASRTVADGVAERVSATEGQIEWDVVVSERPDVDGALRVAAGVDGFTESRRITSDGRPAWQFVLPGGGTLRMDELVVVDATGAELHRALPRVVGGVVELVVPARVLEAARYPLTLDPTVSTEKLAGLLGENDIQWFPAIAWSGTNYLVVWQDFRTDFQGDINGTLLSSTGAVLDADGIPIGTSADGAIYPSVGWNGSTFLVAWEHEVGFSDYDVYGARVTTSGTVLDAGGIAIATTTASEFGVAVAGDGTNFLVTWTDTGIVKGARINTNGQILSPGTFSIIAGSRPAVAWNGSRFLVAFESGTNIVGTRVTTAGVAEDPGGIPISTATGTQVNPTVGSNGTDFLVAWTDPRTGSNRVRAARVTNAGTVPAADANGILVTDTVSEDPAIAWNGTRYFIVWSDNRSGVTNSYDTYGARVSSAGVVEDPASILVGTPSSIPPFVVPAVASNGSNFQVTWPDVAASIDVFSGRITNAGARLDTFGNAVSTGAPTAAQTVPELAWNGSTYLAVWQDHHAGTGGDIYGARLDATGAPLGASFLIAGTLEVQTSPSVASNGTDFLVAWEDLRTGDTDVLAARVTGGGEVLDFTPIAVSTVVDVQGAPSVAWNGSNYLIAWEDFRGGTDYDIYGARVDSAGTLLDFAGIAISTATPSSQLHPAVAASGSIYAVVWTDDRNGNEEIYTSRVNTNGTVLNPTGVRVTNNTAVQRTPDVAGNGTNFLIVWEDHRGTTVDIYGRLLAGTGGLTGPSPIIVSSNTGGDQREPTVAVNGPFLVAWRDLRAGFGDIYATRVDPDGVVMDDAATGFAVSTNGLVEENPALAPGSGGKWGITYSRGTLFSRTISPK